MKIFHIGPFDTPSAGRPFADNTKGASEAARLQAAPKFSAVSATGAHSGDRDHLLRLIATTRYD
jgi:hypothetical protein